MIKSGLNQPLQTVRKAGSLGPAREGQFSIQERAYGDQEVAPSKTSQAARQAAKHANDSADWKDKVGPCTLAMGLLHT